MPQVDQVLGMENVFTFISMDSLAKSARQPKWLIKGILEQETTAMLYGDPESGKSLIALDMGYHVASGKEWCGRRVKQGAVFYICGEGHNGLGRRAKAWRRHNGVPDDEEFPLFCSVAAASMMDATSAASVAAAVDNLCEHLEVIPALIIIDTVARNFGVGDENSTRDMGIFVSNIDHHLKHRLKAAVMMVHHTGHGDKGRARGSIALPGSLDNNYQITRDDQGMIRMESKKEKDCAKPPPQQFALRVIDLGTVDEDGDTVTGATVSAVDFVESKINRNMSAGEAFCYKLLCEWYNEVHATLDQRGDIAPEVLLPTRDWRKRCRDKMINAEGKTYNTAKAAVARSVDSLLERSEVSMREDQIHIYPTHFESVEA